MATVFPAMRGQIGDTEYYCVVMPASWVSNNLVIPSEMSEWEDETVEEKYQRVINYRRVCSQIAPYLASDPHRFFGALIVTAINPDNMAWESVGGLVPTGSIPNLYRQPSTELGFLTLSGTEILVPLDGQHRLAALKFAITGKDNEGEPIEDLTPNPGVGADLITLLIIRHDRERARKIFNKVNRYAKPTSKADNLITSDDDFLAVLARELATDPFTTRLVNVSSNTIAANAPHVTTLGTIYSILELVLADLGLPVDHLPEKPKQKLARKQSRDFFMSLSGELGVFRQALADPGVDGDEARIELRRNNLLMKPFAQVAVAGAVLMLHQFGENGGRQIDVNAAFKKLEKLDWSRSNDEWQGVLLYGDKIRSGSTARRFASKYVAYRLGAAFDPGTLEDLEAEFRDGRLGGASGSLPKPV